MQLYLISLVTFPNNRSFGMVMTLYSCITPIAQMSRKRYYLRADLKLVVSDCCLVSINVATGVSVVNIRLLLSSTSDNITFLRYSFI